MPLKTFIVSFRSNIYGGAAVEDARGFQCEGLDPRSVVHYDLGAMAYAVGERRILFAVHGFNVSWESGLISAARLHDDLRKSTAPNPLKDDAAFVGVLWPGDGKIPFVNYPWEAFDAVRCGALLADLVNRQFGRATSVSFASHSLGARVILAAAERVAAPVDQLIVTAAAADWNCLETEQHSGAYAKAAQVHVLSSKKDRTLKWAYPVGDFASDVMGDGDDWFGAALGLRGPKTRNMQRVLHTPIASKPRNPSLASHYDHCDYFPSSKTPRPGWRKSDTVSDYISAAFAGRRHWPQ